MGCPRPRLDRLSVVSDSRLERHMTFAISRRRCPLAALSTVALAAVAALLGCPVWAQFPASPKPPSAATFYRQPQVFVENRGQWDGDFLYRTRLGAMTVFVEKRGWTFTLVDRK